VVFKSSACSDGLEKFVVKKIEFFQVFTYIKNIRQPNKIVIEEAVMRYLKNT
jgi:hypothetical protein